MTEEESLLTAVLNCRRVDLYVNRPVLTPDQKAWLMTMQQRRLQGEPLQYILGFTDFLGLKLDVDAHVFIPRPETELLVELAIKKARLLSRSFLTILDLGTGSGNIAISLAYFLLNSTVIAIDRSRDALKIARANAQKLGVDHRIQFIHTDMSNYLKMVAKKQLRFDLVISNPPYIPTPQIDQLPAEVRKEPSMALDGGPEGLDYLQEIIRTSLNIILPQGYLLLEMGDGQASEIFSLFAKFPNYKNVEFLRDYSNTLRAVCAQLNPMRSYG